MSGKPPEHNREPIMRAASASPQKASRIPVPIAPKGLQQRVDTQLGLYSVAVSSVRGPQVTSGMEQSTARASGVAPPKNKKEPGALTGKNVVVLKPCDVVERDGTVFMPNTIEMAQLKKAEKGQFKTNVQISSMMTEMDIKKILVETFPFLKCQRFYCAGAKDNRTRLDFYGERRIWDGRFIKQKIKGNSALYIYAEEIPTHSGEQSSLRCSDEGYEHPSKKRKTAQNVSKHSKTNAVNRFSRKRSHSMTSMSVSCPGASDQQSLEQPMSPNTGAITDTSKLAAQMEKLRFREKAGSSGKTVDNGADSRHDSQVSDPMGTTPSCSSDLESDASILSWITSFVGYTTIGEPNIDVFDHFSESTDIDDFQLENGGSRGDGRVLQTTPSCDEDNQRPATHPITVPPPCHPSAPPLNMQLNFVEEHQPQGNNTVQMPAVSKILQGTAPDEYGTNSDLSYTGIGSGYDSTSSGLGNSLDPTETTETTDGDTVLNPSEDDLATGGRTKISIDPSEVDMQGGRPCRIKISPELSSEVQSVRLEVGLGTTHLSKVGEHYEGSPIPPSDKSGWHLAVIWSQSSERIGDTWLYYRTKFETALAIVLLTLKKDPSKYPAVLEGLANNMKGQVSTISGETRSCGRLESTRTVEMLLSLLYKAAEFGAQRFVEMLLNSPFGRSIFHEYKKSALLPEVIARNHGHEQTALYLEWITNRFSQEISPSDLGRIDWSRFLAACNAREDGAYESPQPDGINDIDNSYLGDVESLSSNSSEPKSDSEDGLSEMFSKVSVKEDDIQEEETTAGKETQESNVSLKESINKDQMSGKPVTTSSDHMLFFVNKGKFSRKEIAINRRGKASKLAKGEHRIFRIMEHFNCKFPDLPNMRSMDQPIFWYLLTINTDSINRFLSTMEDRRRIQLQLQRLSGRITTSPLSMLFQAMHIDPEEGTLSFSLSMPALKVENTIAQALKLLSTDAGLSTPSDDTTRVTCKLFDSPLPSNNSTPSDVVALTSVYRPSGKILLSFVSDRNGFLPPESWFEDEDCEVMMECWKWRRCKNNFLALQVIEIKDQPASSGIRAQGRLATGVYKRPLWEEKGLVKRVPENFFGRNWTGKTSLKTSLVWRTNKSRENTEPEPEFLFEEQTSQLIYKRSLKKAKSHSSYAEDLSWNPNGSLTVPLKVIEKAKELSKPTDMSLQDCKQVEKAKVHSQEPSTKGMDPSLKLRVPKQPEDIKDYLMSSVYPPVILNTNRQKTLSCAHADNPYHNDKPKHLVESSYGTLKDRAYSKRLKDPLVVDNKKSESSQNVENLLSFAEKLPPTIKDLKKPQLMRGDVAELKSVISEKVLQSMETDTHGKQDMDPVARGTSKVSSDYSQQIVWHANFDYLENDAVDSDPDSDWLPQLDFNGGDPSAVTPTPELTASSSYSNFDSIPSVASFNVGIQGQMNDDQNQKPEPLKALHPQEWRAPYKTTEDEEKALAIAFEQSFIEYKENYSRLEHRVQQDRSRREAELLSDEFPTRIKENHLRTSPVETGTAILSTGDQQKAIPLCLPNNCKWNSHARECTKTEEQRSSLYVVDEAIEKLREVKGPVCVVSIAGPYRKGKSYILSEAFDQPNVFPLGHEMVAETMGIWLWIVPEKYKDSRGQEFTVVLLDSEGIDAASSIGYDDNQIFTLTVLLASVLIYNSQGVPMRRDLEGLDFIAKLSQRIQVRLNQGVGVKQKETELFHGTFPYFLWLLRDVTQAIPRDCKDLKDYFLKKVFRDQDSASLSSFHHQGQQVAESILRYFSGFEAFHLPPPTAEEDILRTLNENRSQVRPQFLTKLAEFKTLLKCTLLPKHSCFDGQLVTGEGLAALTTLYVEAINTPASVPNVQSAWETFVETKCIDAKNVALVIYNTRMREVLSSKLPCDNDEIRKVHSDSLEECQRHFMVETTGISTRTTEKYLPLLKQSLIQKLTEWQTENTRLTKELCNNLLSNLKRQHLGPILHQLQGHGGSYLSFDDKIGVYHRIKDDYEGQAVGAKDVIAAAFFDFQPELARETKQYLEILRQMKNFDEKAEQEMRVKAYIEYQRDIKRLEEQQLRLQQQKQERKKEMEMVIPRLEKEMVQCRQQMHSELKAQRVQMQNMMAANMKQAEQEREALVMDSQTFEECFLGVQRSNEENMNLAKNMTTLIARQHKEEVLRENAKELPRDKMEGLLNKMSERHTHEVSALLKETDGQFEGAKPVTKGTKVHARKIWTFLHEVPEMIKLRSEAVEDLQEKITETHQEQ